MEKQSGIELTFFLDRTHGKRTARVLESVGISVILHFRWFVHNTPDPEWIAKCGEQNWVILSGDKKIETVPENRQAVIDAQCKVIFFNDSSSLPEEWAAAVIVGRPKLFELIHKNNGPFFLTLDKHARGHISAVRFVGTGGPKAATPEVTAPEDAPPPMIQSLQPERLWVQHELFNKKLKS